MKSFVSSSGLLLSVLLNNQITNKADAMLNIIFINPKKNTNIITTKNENTEVKNEALKKKRGLTVLVMAPKIIDSGKKLTDAASTDAIPVTHPIITASLSPNCPIKLLLLKRNATIPPISPNAKIINN